MNRVRACAPMKAGWVLACILAVAASGCTAGEPANPHLAAPKLVIAPREDGNATVFIHSAFGERVYEWIELKVDNVSVGNRTSSFSMEEVAPRAAFIEARAVYADALYEYRARIDVFPVDERASVTLVEADGDWAREPESFELPYEAFLERRSER